MNLKRILPLLFILLIASFSIFWDLGRSPKGVLVDEASLGFNAYSVLKTGKDEWGEVFPLTLKSFGDYKPAGYIYFAIPFVSIFGLNPLSVRLPSAVGGLFAVVFLYLIIDSLTDDRLFAFFSSYILSTSPWFIYMSRMAWETNLALTPF